MILAPNFATAMVGSYNFKQLSKLRKNYLEIKPDQASRHLLECGATASFLNSSIVRIF